jgi:hypothetical protein
VEKPGVTRGLSVTVGESGEEPGVTRGRRSLGGTRGCNEGSVVVGESGEEPGVTRGRMSRGGIKREEAARRKEGVGPVRE